MMRELLVCRRRLSPVLLSLHGLAAIETHTAHTIAVRRGEGPLVTPIFVVAALRASLRVGIAVRSASRAATPTTPHTAGARWFAQCRCSNSVSVLLRATHHAWTARSGWSTPRWRSRLLACCVDLQRRCWWERKSWVLLDRLCLDLWS